MTRRAQFGSGSATNPNAINGIDAVGTGDDLVSKLSNLSDGETLFLTPGEHVVSGGWADIDGVSDVRVFGAGRHQTTVKNEDGADHGVLRVGNSATVNDLTLDGFLVDGNNDNITDDTVLNGDGIRVSDGQGVDIRDVRVIDTPSNNGNNDADNSVSIGVYYPSTDVTIENFEIENPSAYRGIEITGDDVTVRDGKTKDVIERHIATASMRRDNRVAGDVTVDGVQMETGAGNTTVGSFVAMDGLNYDGTGSYSGSATGTPLGELRLKNIETDGQKRTTIALRDINTQAEKIVLENIDGEQTNEHGVIIHQSSSSSAPNTIIDVDVTLTNVTVKNTGQNSIRLQNIRAPRVNSPRVTNGRVALSITDCPDFVIDSPFIEDSLVGIGFAGTEEAGTITGGIVRDCQNQNVKMEAPKARLDGVILKNPSLSGTGSFSAILTNADDQAIDGVQIYGGGEANNGIQIGSNDCHVTACVVEGVTNNDIKDFGGTSTFSGNDATVS